MWVIDVERLSTTACVRQNRGDAGGTSKRGLTFLSLSPKEKKNKSVGRPAIQVDGDRGPEGVAGWGSREGDQKT